MLCHTEPCELQMRRNKSAMYNLLFLFLGALKKPQQYASTSCRGRHLKGYDGLSSFGVMWGWLPNESKLCFHSIASLSQNCAALLGLPLRASVNMEPICTCLEFYRSFSAPFCVDDCGRQNVHGSEVLNRNLPLAVGGRSPAFVFVSQNNVEDRISPAVSCYF